MFLCAFWDCKEGFRVIHSRIGLRIKLELVQVLTISGAVRVLGKKKQHLEDQLVGFHKLLNGFDSGGTTHLRISEHDDVILRIRRKRKLYESVDLSELD